MPESCNTTKAVHSRMPVAGSACLGALRVQACLGQSAARSMNASSALFDTPRDFCRRRASDPPCTAKLCVGGTLMVDTGEVNVGSFVPPQHNALHSKKPPDRSLYMQSGISHRRQVTCQYDKVLDAVSRPQKASLRSSCSAGAVCSLLEPRQKSALTESSLEPTWRLNITTLFH